MLERSCRLGLTVFVVLVTGCFIGSSAARAASYDTQTHRYTWTDDLSSAASGGRGVPIKAAHIQEIRQAVDEIRTRCGLTPENWAGNPAAGVTRGSRVMGAHMSALKGVIQRIYTDKSLTTLGVPADDAGTTNTVWLSHYGVTGSRIRRGDLQDMRLALDHISFSCSSAGYCGDGTIDAGETCDDSNAVSGDGCSSACLSEGDCGNGVREGAEQCDDGNLKNDDGCSSSCLTDTPTLAGCVATFQMFDDCCGCSKSSGPVTIGTNAGWSAMASANRNPPINDQDKAACIQWRMSCP